VAKTTDKGNAAMSLQTIERIVKAFGSHDDLACPHCGHGHSIHDCDVCSYVVSYWGDDLHDFSCSKCGKDFVVKERVTRQFETAKTPDDFE
jgi:predicted RNA-binding Zn-ribbon protein involved in translation (DUF1610 family)